MDDGGPDGELEAATEERGRKGKSYFVRPAYLLKQVRPIIWDGNRSFEPQR